MTIRDFEEYAEVNKQLEIARKDECVIYGGKKSKSVCFTDEGTKVAEELMQKYMI